LQQFRASGVRGAIPCRRCGGNDRRAKTNGDTTMKKLILGATLALMAAAPALAQPTGSHRTAQRLDDIRAQAPVAASGMVFAEGQFIGADPDPNVRLQLQKDYPSLLDR
jgi:hypothetical protein